MHRKRSIIAGCIIVAYVAYALFTGGLYIHDSHNFGRQPNTGLVNGLESDVYLKPRSTDWGVPFLCSYDGDSGPYGLHFRIWDITKSYSSVEITEIVLKYSDGEIVRKAYGWKWNFDPVPRLQNFRYPDSTEVMKLNATFDDLVERHMDVTITMKGRLVQSDGKEIGFVVAEEFEAKHNFEITTIWSLISRM